MRASRQSGRSASGRPRGRQQEVLAGGVDGALKVEAGKAAQDVRDLCQKGPHSRAENQSRSSTLGGIRRWSRRKEGPELYPYRLIISISIYGATEPGPGLAMSCTSVPALSQCMSSVYSLLCMSQDSKILERKVCVCLDY